MKITRHKVILILLLSTLIFGCSYTKAIRQEEAKNKHNIIIVPFKAAPIKIHPYDIAAAIFPLFGSTIVHEMTKGERETIADTLNKTHGQWNPSVIIARECSNLIKGSTILKTENVILGSSPNRVGRSEFKIIKKAYVLRVLDIVNRLRKVL